MKALKRNSVMVLAMAMIALVAVGCSDDDTNNVVNSAPTAPAMDIVETAVAAGNFTTLVAAVEAAGLVDALKADGPLTVFAPTDAAFAALPAGTVEALLNDQAALTNILLYHVVNGSVKAADVVKLTEATMLNGAKVSITVGSGVMINDANVTTTDILTKNGVIHVIDKVLIP